MLTNRELGMLAGLVVAAVGAMVLKHSLQRSMAMNVVMYPYFVYGYEAKTGQRLSPWAHQMADRIEAYGKGACCSECEDHGGACSGVKPRQLKATWN